MRPDEQTFHQPALKGYLVNLDENYFKVVDEPLKWICQDDPIEPDCYALQLATSTGINVSHSVRQLPGQQELYQSDETVFPAPPLAGKHGSGTPLLHSQAGHRQP